MIQFNLLPDIKLEYIKARRAKRLVMLVSGLVAGLALGIMVIMFVVANVLQRQHLNNLNEDIKQYSKQLRETPDLDKILTVQNQLNSLNGLHDKKPVASRLTGYISKITPADIRIAQLDVDFETSKMKFTGSADTLSIVNKFIDTMKFTTFKAGDKSGNAFSEVVLANFGRDEQGARYEISLKFDPVIFDSSSEVTLEVPNTVTTRSAIERPEELFQPLTNEADQGGQ